MPKYNVKGLDFHAIQVGSEGPDVVMLHGFLGNLAVWHLFIAPQLRKHFKVTTYDLRGHGNSEVTPTGYSAGEMAEDLANLMDTLGIQKAHLVGHSFGADVCLYFALKYPERVDKIVALEPGLAALVQDRKKESWEGWAYWVEKLEECGLTIPEDKKTDLNYLLHMSLETPKFFGPARGLPRNREPLLNLINNTSLIKDYEVVGELSEDAVRTILHETLLVYGEKSHFLGTYDFLKEALPNVKPELLPGGEHFGPLEQPQLLTQHILEFLGDPGTQPATTPSAGTVWWRPPVEQ